MKTKTLGIILISLGVIMIIYTGFNYITSETVLDIGSIEINKEKNHFVEWSPVIGVVVLLGGIILIVRNK